MDHPPPPPPPAASAKILRVARARCAPPTVYPLLQKYDQYYKGSKTFHMAIAADATATLEQTLAERNPWRAPRCVFPNAQEFVRQMLGDPCSLVMKMAGASDPMLEAEERVLCLHAIDLDCEGLTEEQKTDLRRALFSGNCPTLNELFMDFPAYRQCYRDAMSLLEAAKQQGKEAAIISTGFKGFRVLVADQGLYLHTTRSAVTGLQARVKALVQPALKRAFGLEELPHSIDYSVWGDNKGVRTNLHPHPATGLWPLLVHPNMPDRPYGSRERDPETQAWVERFWVRLLHDMPVPQQQQLSDQEDEDDDDDQAPTPNAEPGHEDEDDDRESDDGTLPKGKRAQPTKPKSKRAKKKSKPKKDEEEEEEDANVVVDTHADVAQLLALHGWTPQTASLASATKGTCIVQVFIDKPEGLECERARRVHAHNPFAVRVDRITGDVTPMCADAECYETDYPWTVRHSAGTLGADPLFQLLQRAGKGIGNHTDLAALLAPLVRNVLAYDAQQGAWRRYSADTGTWHLCIAATEAAPLARDLLVAQLQRLQSMAQKRAKVLPSRSKARSKALELHQQLEGYIQSSGAHRYMAQLMPCLQPLLMVSPEQWRSHFSGYLAVSNVLLEFCKEKGNVIAHRYTPALHVRHEYQAPFVTWNPAQPVHEGLEQVLNQWWDPDERRANLQTTAYGLSRHGFLQTIVMPWGPPSSAKSSSFELNQDWFGSNNVFMHTSPALVVQQVKHATHDDNGKGHDSSLMACFDKAIVAFPEPPSTHAWFRDDVVKRMTGDIQCGRQAYSKQMETVPRTYLPIVPCNFLPKPQNASDVAMRRRLHVTTSHRVFYTSEDHKAAVLKRMTPEQRAAAVWCPADPTCLSRLKRDPAAASHYLNLLAAQWHILVVEQKRTWYVAPLAKQVLERYWASMETEQDSVLAFLSQQVSLEDATAVLPKQSLFLAYERWHAHESSTNGAPGQVVGEQSFKIRANTYFQYTDLKGARPTTRIVTKLYNGQLCWSADPVPQVRCYVGLSLVPHPAYPALTPQQPPQ